MLQDVVPASEIDELATFMKDLPSMKASDWREANRNYEFRSKIADSCYELVDSSTKGAVTESVLHDHLGTIYDLEFGAPNPHSSDCETQPILRDIAAILEEAMLGMEVDNARDRLKGYLPFPEDGSGYVRWLKELISDHRAGSHPFYHKHLAEHGTREDIKFLLAQETSLDPRFDDILALIQLGVKDEAKMEIAANYWDEMGNGKLSDVHTVLFSKALNELDVTDKFIDDNYMLEAQLCGNLSAALALSRRHYFKAVGYFGVTEYLAPRRFRNLISAWRRLGLSEDGAHYHDLHISVDAGHANGWFRNVVGPAVEQDPNVGHEIAIGALMRLNTSERYLDALLPHTSYNQKQTVEA